MLALTEHILDLVSVSGCLKQQISKAHRAKIYIKVKAGSTRLSCIYDNFFNPFIKSVTLMYHYLPLLSNVFQSIIYQFVCFNTLINFSVWGSFFKEKGRQKFDAKMRYPTKE